MDKKTIKELANRLRNADENKTACAPLRDIIGTDDIETAYALQLFNNKRKIKKGGSPYRT